MRVAIGAAAALVVLALAATPALAAGSHVFSFAIDGAGLTPELDPRAIAVDNSAGPAAHQLYVTDPSSHRVVRFDPSGRFVLMFGDGVNGTTGGDVCTASSGHICRAGRAPSSIGRPPGALGTPALIAVDPAGGAVYVGDWDTMLASKFASSGQLDPIWGIEGQVGPVGGSDPAIWGIAVAPGGHLFALDPDFGDEDPQTSKIHRFDPDGDAVSTIVTRGGGTEGLAIDADGSYYLEQGWGLIKTGPAGADLGTLELDSQVRGFAIDQPGGDLYVSGNGGNGSIERYSLACPWPSCTPLETFGAEYQSLLGGAEDLAVDAVSDTVYTSRPRIWGGAGMVGVFVAPGIVPEVATGSSTLVSPRMTTIAGSVDPAGNGVVTGCGFEYVKVQPYQYPTFLDAQTVQCAPAPPFHGPTEVGAALPHLEGGSLYRYRLVASNSGGKRTGLERTVQTGSRAEAVTGAAEAIQHSSAAVTGHLDPDSSLPATGCYFEYIPAADYQSGGFLSAETAQCSPDPPFPAPAGVRAVLPGLKPQTTYQYRLRVWDAKGTNSGAVRDFTTAAKGVLQPPVEEEEGEEALPNGKPPKWWSRVRCTKRACSRVFQGTARPQTWRSPKFPTVFGWLFNIYRRGEPLEHTKLVRGCVATFSAEDMLATLNACHGRFRLTYLGTGPFRIRWRVFEYCKCAEHVKRPALPPLSVRGLRPAARMSR